jgi:hypothetical protein
MGLSSSKSKTTTDQKTSETGTTTPTNPPWVTDSIEEYTHRLGAFGDADPNSFVSGSAPLQRMAWENVGSLADWQPQAKAASQMALQAGQSPANLAGRGPMTRGLQAPQAGPRMATQAPATGGPQLSTQAGQAPADLAGRPQPQVAQRARDGNIAIQQEWDSAQGDPARTALFDQRHPGWSAGGAIKRQAGDAAAAQMQPAQSGQSGPAYGYDPATGTASAYRAPQLGDANLVAARGYAAPSAQGTGYAAPRIGQPIGAQAYVYQAQPAGQTQIAPNTDAQAYNYTAQQAGRTQIDPAALALATDAQSQSLLTGLGDYYNPFAEKVVQSTMADFDHEAGRQRAALAAQGAKAGAFGGSRFGVAQAELEGEIGRNRAGLAAGLRSQAFETAAGLSGQDAGRRQDASTFNAQNRTGIASLNAGAENVRALSQAELDQQRAVFNAAGTNEQRQFGAQSGKDVSIYNAGQDQQRNIAQAGLGQELNIHNSGQTNQQRQWAAAEGGLTSRFNAGQDMQRLIAQAGLDEGAARHLADTSNQVGLWNAGAQERAGQFNASLGAETDARNQGFLNQFALERAGMAERQGQYVAGNEQQMRLANLGFLNEAGQWNAGANNQMSQFNAGQQDAAAARQLQAAGLLGDIANSYAGNVRADIGTMAQLGDQQRAIEAQYAMAPLAQLQSLGELYGTTPYNLFSGQNVTGNGTMSGTSVTRQTPSLFNQMLAAASVASKFAGGV